MKWIVVALSLLLLVGLACSQGSNPVDTGWLLTSRPAVNTPFARPLAAETTPAPTETAAPALPAESSYVLFSINIQDFSYPDKSAAVLDQIITLHEGYNVPLDIYLTDVMAQIYADQYPDLLERLKTSPLVAVSYHYRAPRPYANRYDWLGLGEMTAEQLYETILRYETHAVDPVTGQTTDAPGGYQHVAELIGYAPYAASALMGDPALGETVIQIFRELGAQMAVTHGQALNLGDTKGGLPVRPEHYDDKLFEHVGEDVSVAFEDALERAHNAKGGQAPYFVGVKMHDNDFFAAQSAWLTVYLDGGKRPEWEPSLRAPLLSPDEQDAMWQLYEQTVKYVASHKDRIVPVNLPVVLQMLGKN